MKRYLPVFLSILVLGVIIVGVTLWLRMFYQALATYTSPLAGIELPEQSLELPDRSRVVLVLVGGLGDDMFDDTTFPGLSQLAQTGAGAVVYNTPPTYSHTSWLTLLTGATSELNGAPPVDWPGPPLPPDPIDTILGRLQAAQRKSVLFGPADWQTLLPPSQVAESFLVNPASPEADQLVFENAMLSINQPEVDFLLVHFSRLAYAAQHQGGVKSSNYRQAAAQIDSYLLQLAQAIDFGRDTLVIVSDHGYTEAGGLGGSEAELVWQPLVMLGKNISPGRYSDIDQTDLAPTVATLLGLPAPAAAQGRILFETLRLDKSAQSVAQLALARQRIALVEAYVPLISGQSVAYDLPADLSRAQAAFVQGNIDGAFQLAQLTQQTADSLLAAARTQAIRTGQWLRLGLGGGLVLAWGAVMWRLRGPYAGAIIVAVMITVILYHILYQLQGFTYSISAIDDFSAWPLTTARRMGVSFLAGGSLILIVLMLVVEPDWLGALRVSYGFGVLVTFVFSLPMWWAFWQNGFTVTWFLPDIDLLFWQITASIETVIAAMAALFLPWPIMAVILALTLIRRVLNKSNANPETLPGLHLSK